MSSEESDIEDNEEVLIVQPIPWLTEAVVNLKAIIDRQIAVKKKLLKPEDKKKND